MKKLIMAILAISAGAGLYAQNNLFATKAGMALNYANNDAGGNIQGYSVLTIKDVKGSGKNMTITYTGNALDKNRKPVKDSEMTYQVLIKNGVVIMDINQLVPAELRAQGMKIDVKGTPMELPDDLKPGQPLKPYELTITMDLGIMKTNTLMKYEGKCLAIEDVKVPAGTFKCHKISEKITTATMGVNTVSTGVSWWAPNVGAVKTESYDEKNKLVSTSVLTELKGK